MRNIDLTNDSDYLKNEYLKKFIDTDYIIFRDEIISYLLNYNLNYTLNDAKKLKRLLKSLYKLLKKGKE